MTTTKIIIEFKDNHYAAWYMGVSGPVFRFDTFDELQRWLAEYMPKPYAARIATYR